MGGLILAPLDNTQEISWIPAFRQNPGPQLACIQTASAEIVALKPRDRPLR